MGFSEQDPAILQAKAKGLIEDVHKNVHKDVGKIRTKRKRAVKTQTAHWSITLTLPCRVRSELNQRCHWNTRHKRFKEQGLMLFAYMKQTPVDAKWLYSCLPLKVTFTHIGRRMDSDGVVAGFKGLRDELARLIGVDDGDKRITWEYAQREGVPGVEVKIELEAPNG